MTQARYPVDFDLYMWGTDRTAIYHDTSVNLSHAPPEKIAKMLDIFYAASECCNEAGEILGEVKKILRDDGGTITIERRDKVELEIGDTLYGLARICREFDLSFADIVKKNEEKLYDRQERGVLNGSGER